MGWIAVGLGVFLILASLYVEFAGPTAWSGTLEPASQESGMSTYVTPAVVLEPGTYDLHLSYRQPAQMIRITTGRHRVTVSSAGLPGWQVTGLLKEKKRKKGTTVRPKVLGELVAHVPGRLAAPLDLEVQGAGNAPLSVVIRRTRIDYRIPLWMGLILIGLGIAIDPSLRTRLQSFLGLTNACELPPPP